MEDRDGRREPYMVRRRGVDAVVGLLGDEVDAKGDEGDAEARGGVAHLIAQHRMLPPRIPPPEELSRVLPCSRSHFLNPLAQNNLLVSLSSFHFSHFLTGLGLGPHTT